MSMSPLKATLRRILDDLRRMPSSATPAEALETFRRLLASERAKGKHGDWVG